VPFVWSARIHRALSVLRTFFKIIAERLMVMDKNAPPAPWMHSTIVFAVMLATAWWLHRKKIYIRV
jgi:hypothetical protein